MSTETGDILELTDEFGCSLDYNLVTNFHSTINDITKVKETVAELTVPTIAFGRKIESVKIKCNLVVCEQNCPMVTCDKQNEPIREQDRILLETQALFARKQQSLHLVDEVS